VGRVEVEPGAANAVCARVRAWLDARAPDDATLHRLVQLVEEQAAARAARDGTEVVAEVESLSPRVDFAAGLRDRLVRLLGGVPVLATGAGHDAGVLATAGIPAAMLFVRNPTGVSHAPGRVRRAGGLRGRGCRADGGARRAGGQLVSRPALPDRTTLPTRPGPARGATTLAAVGLWPVLVLAAAAVADLPPELAVGWGGRGPDAFSSTRWLTGLAVATGAAAVLVVGVALALPGPRYLARRFAVGVAATVAGGAAGLWGMLATAALTAADASDPPPPAAEVLVLLVAVLVATSLAGFAYGQPPFDPAPGPPPVDLPRADLPPGQSPRWSYTGMSGFFMAAVLLLLMVGAVLFRIVQAGAVLCWVMAALTLVLVRLRFAIDERGLTLRAWGRGPAGVLPWDRIVEARAVRVRLLQWGGWGFRLIPGRVAIGLRKGPALVLTLTDGRRLGVTLDEPVLPAGLVNAHLDHLRGRA